MGQMVRGGRSWPPERKLGAGADKAGKTAIRDWRFGGTSGQALSRGVGVQQVEHRLHLSPCPLAW